VIFEIISGLDDLYMSNDGSGSTNVWGCNLRVNGAIASSALAITAGVLDFLDNFDFASISDKIMEV